MNIAEAMTFQDVAFMCVGTGVITWMFTLLTVLAVIATNEDDT